MRRGRKDVGFSVRVPQDWEQTVDKFMNAGKTRLAALEKETNTQLFGTMKGKDSDANTD